MADGILVKDLNAWFGTLQVLRDIGLAIAPKAVTAIIGPSGCGKSTFIRCLNRMHEVVPSARVSGTVLVEGANLYAPGVDPVEVRRRIGMVFQRANPFPTMSAFDNVAAGLRLAGVRNRAVLNDAVERALTHAALWDEVKDRLDRPGSSLSGGQQQRLCIARALAVGPEVLLMDEPCSALDPIATAKIEELILELRKDLTIVIVTHNMQQAARVSEATGFFLLGELVEFGVTRALFTNPRDRQVNAYDVEIDEKCVELLALHQPTAGDLRFLTTTLKIVTDLERIGDQAVNIAQRALELNREPQLKPYVDLPRMAERAQRMVKESLDAFVSRDTELARRVCGEDADVDALKEQVFRELLTFMMEDPRTIPRAIRLILISRFLERVADHATNIAEMVIYMVESKIVRHTLA